MFVKKTIALLVATAVFLAPTVSAGNVRGLKPEDGTVVEVESDLQRRVLKEENKNVVVPTIPPVTVPTLPPAPIPPPTPPAGDRLISQCDDGSLFDCVVSRGSIRNYNICKICLTNLVQNIRDPTQSAAIACGRRTCNGCIAEAIDVFECGTGTGDAPSPVATTPPVVAPTPSVAPVPVPTAPVPTTAPVDTSGLCPSGLPGRGDACMTGGLPWIYCCYAVDRIDNRVPREGEGWVCSCTDNVNRFMCNVASTSVCPSIIQPGGGTAPVPVPVINPTVAPVPVPVVEPTDAPVPVPVVDPTEAPVPVPVVDPTDAPVPVPVINPTDSPIPLPVSPPVMPPINPDIPEFCQNLDGVPVDGTSCEGVLPDDMTSGGCGGEILYFDENGDVEKAEMAACSCDKSNPIWMCTSVVTTKEPSPAPPPAQPPTTVAADICESIPVPMTGDNCTQNFMLTMNYLACTFMQVTTDSNGVETSSSTVTCGCDARNTTDISTVKWDCDGTLAPITAPSLMPAGEPQPVSMMPVSLAPVPTVPPPVTVPTVPPPVSITDICPPQSTPPDTGDSCAGVLPTGLSSATCNYQQTVSDSISINVYQKACTCRSADEMWSCSGGIPPPVAAPAPVAVTLPEPAPVPVTLPEPAPVPVTMPEPAPVPATEPIPVFGGDSPGIVGQTGCVGQQIVDGEDCSAALGGQLQLTCIVNGQQCNCASQAVEQVWGCRPLTTSF